MNLKKLNRFLIHLILSIVIFSCTKEENGDTVKPTAVCKGSEYYPSTSGSSWTYNLIETYSGNYETLQIKKIEIIGDTSVGGIDFKNRKITFFYPNLYPTPYTGQLIYDESIFRLEENNVLFLKFDKYAFFQSPVEVIQYLLCLDLGETKESIVNIDEGSIVNGLNGVYNVKIQLVEVFTSLEISGQTFKDVRKYSVEYYRFTLDANGNQVLNLERADYTWLARNVGVIKSLRSGDGYYRELFEFEIK